VRDIGPPTAQAAFLPQEVLAGPTTKGKGLPIERSSMALRQQRGAAQAYRSWSEEIEVHPGGSQPQAPMPEVEWTVPSESIDLHYLIEDVGSLLPAATMESTVLTYDLAADLPLIEGDYRFIRRLFLNLLSAVNGNIFLRARLTQADRDYLNDNFPGADLPEGEYVLIQVAETDVSTKAASRPGFGSICQFLFPCAATERKAEPARTVEPLVRRTRAGANRKWLITKVQRPEMEMQSACYTR
jgi:hypothetical protein